MNRVKIAETANPVMIVSHAALTQHQAAYREDMLMTPKGLTIATALGAACIMLSATQSFAIAPCGPRDKIVEKLEVTYGEALAGGGLQSTRQVIEIWAAPETGTFTVLMTNTAGLTCVVASGTDWHQQKPKMKVKGIPG